jgi:hypothetical protein
MPDPGVLYIRWAANGSDDNRTDPGSAVSYLSHSLQVVNPADPTQDPGLALVGRAQQIRVLVDTQAHTTEVGVQVWACAWGTAGQPFLPSTNGTQGLSRDLDDSLNPYVADPAPPAPQLAIDLDWTPLASDLTSIGASTTADLHVCLLANVYSTAGVGDGAIVPPPGPPVLNVATNRHHAQHNIALHPVPAGMKKFHVRFWAGNPFARGTQAFGVAAVPVLEAALGRDDLARLARGRWLREDPELPGRGGRPVLSRERLGTVALHPERKALRPHRAGPKLELELEPGKPRPITLEVEVPDAEPGALHVLDLVQHGKRGIVGGARALLLCVDRERYEGLHAQPRPVRA